MTEAARKIEAWALFALVALWSFAWDYQHVGDFQRDGKLKLMLFTAAFLAALRVAKTWHWSVAAFYVYLAGSWLHFCFSTWTLPVSGKVFIFEVHGHEEMASITALLFLCPLLSKHLSRRTFESMTIAAACAHAVIGVLNLRGIYPFLPITVPIQENFPIGLLGQQTILGPFLAYGFGLCLARSIDVWGWANKGLYAALGAFLFAVAVLTKSSMTYGSLAAAIVVIALFYWGRLAAFLGILGTVAALLIARRYFDQSVFWHSGRLEPWLDAISLWRLRPWVGFGIGGWESAAGIIKEVRHYDFPWSYLHSDPLQGLVELGKMGMGLIAIVGLFVAVRIRELYRLRNSYLLTWVIGLAVFGADSLGNFILHLVPHGPIFALCIYQLLRSGQAKEL